MSAIHLRAGLESSAIEAAIREASAAGEVVDPTDVEWLFLRLDGARSEATYAKQHASRTSDSRYEYGREQRACGQRDARMRESVYRKRHLARVRGQLRKSEEDGFISGIESGARLVSGAMPVASSWLLGEAGRLFSGRFGDERFKMRLPESAIIKALTRNGDFTWISVKIGAP